MIDKQSNSELIKLFYKLIETEDDSLIIRSINEKSVFELISAVSRPELEICYWLDDERIKSSLFIPLISNIIKNESLRNIFIQEIKNLFEKDNSSLEDLMLVIIECASREELEILINDFDLDFLNILIKSINFGKYDVFWDDYLSDYIGDLLSSQVRLAIEKAIQNNDMTCLYFLIYNNLLNLLSKEDTLSLFTSSELNIVKFIVKNIKKIDENKHLLDGGYIFSNKIYYFARKFIND